MNEIRINCRTCKGRGDIEFESAMMVKPCPVCRATGRDAYAERDALAAELAAIKGQEPVGLSVRPTRWALRPTRTYGHGWRRRTKLYTTPQPSQDVHDLTLTPAAQAILTECIGAHAYVLQAIVNGRPDLALTEAKKWVDGFKQAADHHRQAQRKA